MLADLLVDRKVSCLVASRVDEKAALLAALLVDSKVAEKADLKAV